MDWWHYLSVNYKNSLAAIKKIFTYLGVSHTFMCISFMDRVI